VYFSEVGYPNRVKATSILNFDTKNAETITALQVFDEGLLIFKESSIDYLVSGNFETGVGVKRIPLNVTCGTAFADTVQVVENAVLYLGSNGLYRLRLPSLSIVISTENVSEYAVAEEIKGFKPVRAFAAVFDGVYYFSIVNNLEQREYRYYLRQKAFYGAFTQDFNCYAVDLLEKALYLGCANGYVLRYDKDSFDYFDTASGLPRPVVMEVATKAFDLTGALVRDAKVKDLLVAVKQFPFLHSRLSVDIEGDCFRGHYDIELDESGVYDDDYFDHAYYDFTDMVVKDVWINKIFKRAKLIIKADGLGEPVLIYGLSFVFKPKKPKGHREGVRKGVFDYGKA
jgi:hypothetical protein